ncbi:aminotransferase class I/II-fold pyridoxal phosphate-dependent enzyme [Vibrio sp. JPW-9-11-11]|uniref:aminotransferase class I/II-fold pyridoxal phosphate-dependent enzyme n=1 Tax=Vibrio sp. JPW-9-11-11 TaxID=1416532 RepID=UPI001594A4D1|nr:aminotransferase class I/II-fold pyridoxal phosphate-dependent enzyme [Vibrio sp. JPW-9-11-11]NVD08928.1 aminotransferase class I/II-fold pyridoxal phosphate-dependent enzyme [Vibrio sp. JPW-9-11-11]
MKVKIKGQTGQELFESVRCLIASGELKEGDALPPVRELATEVGVNRNTVAGVYQRLVKSGLAETKGRLGTRVKSRQSSQQQDGITETKLMDLADGNLRKEWFPSLDQLAAQAHLKQFVYGEAPILPEIEQFGREWFKDICPPNMGLSITSGAVDSLERLMSAHLLPGDQVIVEDPCYLGSSTAIKLAGMHPVGVSIDSDGMVADELESKLSKGARAVLLTPRAHNPTGCCYSKQRAEAIREVLSRYPNVLVLIDDHYALLAEQPYYNLIAKNSLYWGVFRSVSKGLGPDLRLAFVAADPVTTERLQSRLTIGMNWVSRILQSLVITALKSDSIDQQLQVMSQHCRQRNQWLIEALEANGLSIPGPVEGVNLWVPVNGDPQASAYELSKRGWLVRPGNQFDIDGKALGLRVTTTKLSQELALQLAKDIALAQN